MKLSLDNFLLFSVILITIVASTYLIIENKEVDIIHQEEVLPDGWEKVWSVKDKKYYYHNTRTKTTQEEKPKYYNTAGIEVPAPAPEVDCNKCYPADNTLRLNNKNFGYTLIAVYAILIVIFILKLKNNVSIFEACNIRKYRDQMADSMKTYNQNFVSLQDYLKRP